MAKVYLIRHGEVAGNAGARLFFSGWDDVPLTARGEAQARAVGKYLSTARLGAIYSSDLQRAARTAQEIAAFHPTQVLVDRAWREINFGDWAGASEADLLEKWPELWRERQADPENVRSPNGENLRDLWARVEPAWQNVVSQHSQTTGSEHEDVAIVAHQGTIRILLLGLLGAPPGSYRALSVRNCSVSTLALAANRVTITGFNFCGHMDEADAN